MTVFDEMNADLIASELGRECIRVDVAGSPLFRGILENKYLTSGGDDYAVEDEFTVLGCVASDVLGIEVDEKVMIDNKEYTVASLRPDHDGWMELVVEATE